MVNVPRRPVVRDETDSDVQPMISRNRRSKGGAVEHPPQDSGAVPLVKEVPKPLEVKIAEEKIRTDHRPAGNGNFLH